MDPELWLAFLEKNEINLEQERSAIARELHNELGGDLTAVNLQMDWMLRHTDNEESRQRIHTVKLLVGRLFKSSQRVMMGLRPPQIEKGLAYALDWLCRDFQRRNAITTQLNTAVAASQFSDLVSQTVYRCAQEALTNALKYAQCDQISLDLVLAEGKLSLRVQDNGVGFAPEDLDKPNAFGIKGMVERARSLQGRLACYNTAGACVLLEVPWPV